MREHFCYHCGFASVTSQHAESKATDLSVATRSNAAAQAKLGMAGGLAALLIAVSPQVLRSVELPVFDHDDVGRLPIHFAMDTGAMPMHADSISFRTSRTNSTACGVSA